MNIKKQYDEFCQSLKEYNIDTDIILMKYWFCWCCPKKELIPRSRKMAYQLSWLLKSPLIKESWYFELSNVSNNNDETYDEINIINEKNENIYVLSYKYDFEESGKIDLWSIENNYSQPLVSNNIKNIQNFLKIEL